MLRAPPKLTLQHSLFPYTTRCRSRAGCLRAMAGVLRLLLLEPQAPFVPDFLGRPFELLHPAPRRLLELQDRLVDGEALAGAGVDLRHLAVAPGAQHVLQDRKSTRLNSSH